MKRKRTKELKKTFKPLLEVSVPAHELWLYRNPEALKIVVRGLKEARGGELKDLGSFAKFADDEIEFYS
jgi:hypothetical protein